MLLSLLVPGTGWAQQGPVAPRAPNSRDELAAGAQAVLSADFQLGPFFLQPTIASGAGYESVSNRRQEDDPSKPVLDFRITVTPGLGIALPIKGRHFLSFSPNVRYDWFREFEELRRFNIILPASYAFSSSRLDLTLRGTYVDGQRGAQDPTLVDGEPVLPDSEIDDFENFTSKGAGVSTTFWLTPRTSLGVTGGYQQIRYEDTERADGFNRGDRNRDTLSYGASWSFDLSPAATIAAVYRWQEQIPENPESFRALEEKEVGVNLDLTPSPSFQASVLATHLWQQHDDPERENFRGLVFSGRVSMQPGGVVSIRLDAERGLTPSFWQNNSSYVRYGGGGSIEVAVSSAVVLGARAAYHRHEYPNVSIQTQLDGSLLVAKREDELSRWSGTLRWSITARNAFQLEVGRHERLSNFDRNNLDGVLLRVGFSVAY